MASSQNVEERLRTALADRYLIRDEVGRGGMATVYLAQDLKHDRKVAVKVLKPELALVVGTDRFLAEIRTTANLAHPHILPLHDSGEADGFLFYVMPYVEGESLRERLDREGQLSVEEAVRIAGHVADALESAHRHNVIHRDIKPANILFQEGEPVVTDFGIALAVSAAGEGRLTETGLSLGTPYYMSPEQAAGDRTPTASSDVYSLGCVLYEMLTGDPPHTGSSAQAIMGKILLGEVTRPTKLRRTIPANVEGVILKALERLPADRFKSSSELAAALKDKGFRHGLETGAAGEGPWKKVAISLGGVAVLALALAVTFARMPETPPPTTLLQIHPPGDGPRTNWARYFALAPDGSSMVYSDTTGLESGWQLWMKERGSAVRLPITGTDRAADVLYSPDGQWIAYVAGGNLIKQPLQGAGGVILLENVDTLTTALDWLADGTLLCEQGQNTLVRISEEGDALPDTVVSFGSGNLIWVHGLPGEEAALAIHCPGIGCPTGGGALSVVDLNADTAWTVLDGVFKAWYVHTGHVVWVRQDGSVFATPFDLGSLEISDSHMPLLENVRISGNWLRDADMVMGDDGTVVLVQGAVESNDNEPLWVNREGQEEMINWGLTGRVDYPVFSPDGTQVALENEGIWVIDLDRGAPVKLTEMGGTRPAWTPDGRSVTFTFGQVRDYDVWISRADGSGDKELLLDYDRAVAEAVWSPDGAWLVFRTSRFEDDPGDIMAWKVGQDDPPMPLLATEFRETAPTLSPNGRFLAYSSNRSAMSQVYVVPFPDVEERQWQVSVGEGQEPVWGKGGDYLYYRRGDTGDMVAVEVATADSFRIGEERVLFPAGGYEANLLHPRYDVSPDGQRFIMLRLRSAADNIPDPIMIQILNWFTELEGLVEAGGRVER